MAWEVADGDDITAEVFNNAAIGTGVILPYAGSSAPNARWLLCDGTAISRSTYADLFSLLGTKYGAGNGTTTFNLPNLKGRIPVGLDGSITDFNDRGKTGGEKTHTLTLAETPAHTHAVPLSSGGAPTSGVSGAGQSVFGSMDTDSKGGGGAHENMPPYLIVNYIIKI